MTTYDGKDLKFVPSDGWEGAILKECIDDYDVGDIPAGRVVDIGAHVGVVSLYMARKYGCHVDAYEPEPENYRRLVANVELNGLGALVAPHNVAITKDGRDVIIGGTSSISADVYTVWGKPVKSITLADILTSPIGLLKFDCEGAEFEMFTDLPSLAGRVGAIRGEIHPTQRHVVKSSEAEHAFRGNEDDLVAALTAVVPNTRIKILGR